jgi:hypothetical protein
VAEACAAEALRDFFSFLAISKNLRILKEIKLIVLKNVQRNQKSGNVERQGLCRPDCGGGVELSDRNGLVPHEEERYGLDEVRRAAKTGRVRKPQAVQGRNDHEARECTVFLALAAARPRVPGAGERKRGARITVGSEPAQVS